MFYFLNLKNFYFNKPINNISLKIFRFNNFLIFLSISFFFLIFLLISFFFIFNRKKIKSNYFCLKKLNIFKEYLLIIILFIILLLICFSTYFIIKFKKSKIPFVTIKIIGYQWRWYYHYINGLGKNINYFSNIFLDFFQILNLKFKNNYYLQEVDNKLIIPSDKTIRFIFTSNDVIHSFFVPSLCIKQDAIPGFYRDLYFSSKNVGKYKGYCTELCGKYHSYMPIVLNIVSLNNYKKWVLCFFYKKLLKINF
ncbi:Cytochrome c oxidase polypeptide II [Candidatus Nasuia deltocephalinicola]|nr:Cytochrome c oxidase polypeptide II [Candidatus Nasuia deltocephalinicola]